MVLVVSAHPKLWHKWRLGQESSAVSNKAIFSGTGGLPRLAYVWAILSCLVSCGLAGEPSGRITGRELYAEVSTQLAEDLDRPDRFTLLPNNLEQVVLHPKREPIFCIAAGPGSPTNLEAIVSGYLSQRGAFRLVQGGEIIGISQKETVLCLASVPLQTDYKIIGTDGKVRSVQIPGALGSTKAFRAGPDWGFKRDDYLLTSSATNADSLLRDPGNRARIIQGEGEAIIITRPEQRWVGANESPLVIAVKDAHGLRKEVFRDFAALSPANEGVVRLHDGRWLGIGYKLIILRADFPPEPPLEQLEAVVKSAQTGDRASFEKALAVVTQYTPGQLAGLCKQLRELAGPEQTTEEIERGAMYALRAAKSWQPRARLSKDEQARAREATAAYIQSLQQFLKDWQEIQASPLGVPLEKVPELIAQGFQFYDGRWIASPKVLAQDGPGTAVLDAAFAEPSLARKRGLFRLSQDGRLVLLGEYQDMVPQKDQPNYSDESEWQYLKMPDGQELLFWPKLGLAQVTARGKLEWLERSGQFKTFEHMLGCDHQNRIYFASGPNRWDGDAERFRYQTPATVYWIYRPQAPSQPSPVRLLFPVTTQPVMDGNHRVWFLSRGAEPVAQPGSLGESKPVLQAMQQMRQAARQSIQLDLPDSTPREFRFPYGATLYSYQDKTVSLAISNLSPGTALVGGRDGQVIGIKRGIGGAPGTFLISEGTATIRSNLHALAREKFKQLFDAAPAETRPIPSLLYNNASLLSLNSSFSYPAVGQNPSLCRSGDLLWINQDARVEVYQNGNSLGFQERRTLVNCPSDLMLGPLDTAGGPAMFFLGLVQPHFPTATFWALSGTNGINLQRASAAVDPPSTSLINASLSMRNGYPLFSTQKGCLYFASGHNTLEVDGPESVHALPDSGFPVLLTREAELVVERWPRPYRGSCLCSGDRRLELLPTFSRVLAIAAETDDRLLLCFSPEGLVWLKRGTDGGYVVSRELRLNAGGLVYSFLGETEHELVLTLVDGRAQSYLAVVDKQ